MLHLLTRIAHHTYVMEMGVFFTLMWWYGKLFVYLVVLKEM